MDIAVKDSLAIIVFSQDDTCGAVYNMDNHKMIRYFGIVGEGPGEVHNINFVTNKQEALDKDSLYFYDVNRGRLLGLPLGLNENRFKLKEVDSPKEIYASSYINFSGDLLVGRKSGSRGKMFFIYHYSSDKMQLIDYYPDINGLHENSKGLLYAPHLALNEKKGKIVAGMCFMDLIQVYNTYGEREKTICFSKQPISRVNQYGMLDVRRGFFGMCDIYPTEDYCYIRRNEFVGENQKITDKTIFMKMDWNGNLIKSYVVTGNIPAGFCIDEKNNRLYVIHNIIDADNAEYDDVVYYDISVPLKLGRY
ncbi:MAG: BF3164 family lipoprotein [Bacteroidales bacterium]|nr:BF3164 family lipoprotein [Bacteroidales bacterium]